MPGQNSQLSGDDRDAAVRSNRSVPGCVLPRRCLRSRSGDKRRPNYVPGERVRQGRI